VSGERWESPSSDEELQLLLLVERGPTVNEHTTQQHDDARPRNKTTSCGERPYCQSVVSYGSRPSYFRLLVAMLFDCGVIKLVKPETDRDFSIHKGRRDKTYKRIGPWLLGVEGHCVPTILFKYNVPVPAGRPLDILRELRHFTLDMTTK
jgi:hypothetical protein